VKTINSKVLIHSLFAMILLVSCNRDYVYEAPPPPPPHVAGKTSTLEAWKTTSNPNAVSSPFWKNSDYYEVVSENMSTGLTYSDGWLNMTGTFNGKTDFNKGNDPRMVLKAAYDDQNLYIYAEWKDTTVNLSEGSWLFYGPSDPKKADVNANWTSQRNTDRIAFAFDIDNAAGTAGSFATVGCQAACHGSGASATMYPTAGKVDIWDWNLATSVPLGYVQDKVATSTGLAHDAGTPSAVRNAVNSGNPSRSGPAYEWDTTNQYYTNPFGQKVLLNKNFYLLNKAAMIGDAANGKVLYDKPSAPGDCISCHGAEGVGGSEMAVNSINYNKDTREALIHKMDDVSDMSPYWAALTLAEKNDIITYMRGLSGVPGYYLQTPSGSCSDVLTQTNITPTEVDNASLNAKNKHGMYKVVIIRKLKTNNPDDVQFDLNAKKTYTFGVALMDNDGRNHIGSKMITLTFK
jgi:mono/diheme cytochrome c family protein